MISKREISPAELDLQMALYVDRLLEWPRDVALQALREWPSRSKYWPAWEELEVRMGKLTRWRRDALAALEFAAAATAADPPREYDPNVAAGLKRLVAAIGQTAAAQSKPPAPIERTVDADAAERRRAALAALPQRKPAAPGGDAEEPR